MTEKTYSRLDFNVFILILNFELILELLFKLTFYPKFLDFIFHSFNDCCRRKNDKCCYGFSSSRKKKQQWIQLNF